LQKKKKLEKIRKIYRDIQCSRGSATKVCTFSVPEFSSLQLLLQISGLYIRLPGLSKSPFAV